MNVPTESHLGHQLAFLALQPRRIHGRDREFGPGGRIVPRDNAVHPRDRVGGGVAVAAALEQGAAADTFGGGEFGGQLPGVGAIFLPPDAEGL